MAADEATISPVEKEQLHLYKQFNPLNRKGTSCELKEGDNLLHLISSNNDIKENEGKTAYTGSNNQQQLV